MLDLTLMFYVMAVPAVVIAGVSKGGFGGSAAFAAAPFLALVLEPVQAVALMLPLLMVIDATSLKAWWGLWDRRIATILVGGMAVGTAVGAMIFAVIDPSTLKLLIGLIALGFVAFQLSRNVGVIRGGADTPPISHGVAWSTLAGVTSFISHAGGPPATIYLLGLRLSKETYQATMVIAFAIINALKFFIYAAMGLFDARMGLAILTLVPVAIAGTYLGVWAHRQMSERTFYTLIYVFLTITGGKLVIDALA